MPEKIEKPELRPAATNPWYVLMTVAGEQMGQIFYDNDWALHGRNRRYWNGWQAQALSDNEKAKLIADGRATEADLAPLTEDENADVAAALAERCPDAAHPEPVAPVDLAWCRFEHLLYCHRFVFWGANFTGATFSGDASFVLANFFAGTNFKEATFSGHATFQIATFSDDAYFQSVTFSGNAKFSDATFFERAFFASAMFPESADFRSATFSRDARFKSATFCGPADFRGAAFSGAADFSDATFKSATRFGPHRDDAGRHPSKFHGEPPAFFGATLHEDTDFTDVEWPLPPGDADLKLRHEHAIRHRRAYERLKLLMDSQKRWRTS
jgi:uncharacterized protein YjbI with pentapeptide repeats